MILSNSTLSKLPDTILKPNYNRAGLKPGIIHVGLGNFHRAHQSWYLHRLFTMERNLDWAIIGAGVRDFDKKQRQDLLAQDCMTTLIELDPSGISAEIVGSMIDYIPIEEGNAALIARMAQPDIRIVSMTVTEGGYFINPANKLFDEHHPDIIHDAANPEKPKTVFGAMIAALRIRRDKGYGPFTAQSCDNIQGNGDIMRQTLVSLAKLTDKDLAKWIDENCTFPNSMVDCIVPATGDKERKLAKDLGVEDRVPVTHENFRQWVIEDKFCQGRPDWDLVGVTFTKQVHDYEAMKIRILNAGHQIIANAGELLSVETISGCMENALISALLHKVETEEILPYVKAVPNMTPTNYLALIEKRFQNPRILDTTRRVAFDGSSRHTGFLLPILRDALAAKNSVKGLALVEALWARMCYGTREDGSTIAANDPFWDALQSTAKEAKNDPIAWLEQKHIYGDLIKEESFTKAFCHALTMLWQDGVEETLKTYLQL